MPENKKMNNVEELTTWLARETGHIEVPDEGYGEVEPKLNFQQKKRKDLGKFFDGLQVEKAMQDHRRSEAMADVDDAAALRQAIAPRMSEGTQNVAPY